MLADAALAARITAVFDEHQRYYGAKRITAELSNATDVPCTPNGGSMNSGVDRDEVVNHKRVERLMKANGLFGYTRRRKVKTTVAGKHQRVFAELVNRSFLSRVGQRSLCR